MQTPLEAEDHGAAHCVATVSTSLKAAACVSGCWYPSEFPGNLECKPLPKAGHCQFAGGHTHSSVRAGALSLKVPLRFGLSQLSRHSHPERRELLSYPSM